MPIVPDTKDWTWVLEKRCPECGFDSSGFLREHVSQLIEANAQTWALLAERHADAFQARPEEGRWSGLEYACHVRDVFRLYDYRLHLMLDQDDPTFPNWDQDVTAVEERYDQQVLHLVVGELVVAADVLADSFATVDGPTWERTGSRSDGARFTIETFARYLIHDPIHHVWDVEQNIAMLRQ